MININKLNLFVSGLSFVFPIKIIHFDFFFHFYSFAYILIKLLIWFPGLDIGKNKNYESKKYQNYNLCPLTTTYLSNLVSRANFFH